MPALDEGALARQREDILAKREKELETFYGLSEEDQVAMQTEPGATLPKLAAKLHIAVQSQVAQAVAQALPSLVQGIIEQSSANQKARETFYGVWPGLANHESHVLQTGEFFRRANPSATPAEATERIGALVCAALGIDPATVRKQAAPPAVPSPPAAPFRPAAPGGAVGRTPPPSTNQFEALAEEFLLDDTLE